jgi:hypothetical protein
VARTRRRLRWLLSIVVVANLAAVGLLAAPSQAWGVSRCSGTAENLTIFGDLTVPEGASCALVNTRVIGDVEVRAEANLTLDASKVWGDLTVRAQGFLDSIGSSVVGTTRLRDAFGAVLEGSELRRVDVRGAGFLISDGSTHRSDLDSRNGQTVVLSSRITGDLSTTADLLTDLRDSVVTGRLSVAGAQFGSVVCRSEIDGNADLAGNLDLIQLGDGAFVGCEFNVFGRDVGLRDNLADIQINGNVIRGDLTCTGNDPAPTGFDNRIRGAATGQCAGLAEAGAPAAGGFSPPEPAGARIAPLQARADARAGAAQAAAAAAGRANL